MQNVMGQAASIKNDGKMVLAYAADLPLALIDVRDTGAVGARILLDPAPHAGKTYEFTGAATNSPRSPTCSRRCSAATITYVGSTLEQTSRR